MSTLVFTPHKYGSASLYQLLTRSVKSHKRTRHRAHKHTHTHTHINTHKIKYFMRS